MIKVGIIGAGRVSRVHARAIQKIPEASLSSVFDPEGERSRALTAAFGGKAVDRVDELWESPVEAVIICPPTFLHKEYCLEAVRAGKHVLCEKPIASSLEDAREMIDKAREAGIRFLVGHALRFHPAFLRIQDFLRGGNLGSIRHFQASRVSGGAGGSWKRWLLERPDGLGVIDLNIHDLDLLYWMLGRPASILAKGIAHESGTFHHLDSLLEFRGNIRAAVEGSFLPPSQHPFQYRLRLLGSEGSLEFGFRGMSYEDAAASQEMNIYTKRKRESVSLPMDDPYVSEIKYFLDCIKEKKQVQRGNPADAQTALEIALAARESAQTGQPFYFDS